MANQLYADGREGFLTGNISWSGDDIKCVLVDTDDYTADISAGGDRHLSDIPSGARVATSGNLTNKTTTGGVADADDVTFSSVSGDESEALVIYQDTGSESTSRLIAYIDTATGLPVVPSGVDIKVTWPNGSNRIFKL